MENSVYINGVKTYAFKYQKNLLDFVAEKKIILIAINTEKILKEDLRLKQIINKNIGYANGVGEVLALKQKGYPEVKIACADLWLDIIKIFYNEKTFYLLGLHKILSIIQLVNWKKNTPISIL